MRWLRLVRVGLKALTSHPMRTFFMMAGTILGVASLTVVMAMNDGARASLEERLAEFGTDLIRIRAGGEREGGPASRGQLTLDDARAIRSQVDGLDSVVPSFFQLDVEARHKDADARTLVVAASPEVMEDSSYELERGRPINDLDDEVMARVCLIGPTLQEDLFGDEDPVGKRVLINRVGFRVVGVLSPQGAMPNGIDFDNRAVMPLMTGMRRVFHVDDVSAINARTLDEALIPGQVETIRELLRKRHRIGPGQDEDFRVRTASGFMEWRMAMVNQISLLLGILAALSLVVGGVVLMNIMLVSVGERTREIGLRRALGASGKDVMMQFLAESVVVNLVGLTLGTLLGVLVFLAISHFVPDMAARFSLRGLGIATAFSVAVGMGFGTLPAKKAASLSPVEALR